jgi:hypothetical protein
MANARFAYETNEDSGILGWRLKKHPFFYPVGPEGLAHDILEHHPGDRGTVLEEIRAQGAFVFVEVQSGYLDETYQGSNSVPYLLASAIISTVRTSRWTWRCGTALPKIPATVRNCPLEDENADETLLAVCKELENLWDGEFDEEWLQFNDAIRPRWPLILREMRNGYRFAKRRYWSAAQAGQLYDQIGEIARRLTADAYRGDEMVLHYRINDSDVYGTLAREGIIIDTAGRRFH